jgi:type IV pilus assembly protein PilC
MDFKYKAKNLQGGVQTGVVKAADQTAAMDVLAKNNLDVFMIEPVRLIGGISLILSNFFNRISPKDLVIFSRQLSVLIKSNVSVIKSLKIISEQTESGGMKNVCVQMATAVEEGKSLADAVALFPKQFDNFFASVIRSGETSGNLEHSLIYLADHVERAYELKRKIKGAMMYPVAILTAFCGIFFFLMVKVLPQLTDILTESGVALPWTTKLIIWLSDFMKAHWVITLAMILITIGTFFYYSRTKAGKKQFDTLIFRIPVIGTVIRFAYIARFAENLRVLLTEGISLVKALDIMAAVMDNEVYRILLLRIMKNVEKGKSMTEAMLEDEQAFPRMVSQMIKIGEDSGRTTEILENIENFYTKEVNNMTENMTTLIEPLLIVILGLGTGILVVAIIMPIYDMAGAM